jgi:rSAM/selenodomain-associated transferase 1
MIPWLDDGEALHLHQALLEDSLRLLTAGALAAGAVPFLSLSEPWEPEGPDGHAGIAAAAAGIARLPQSGTVLGERLRGTFQTLFARAHRRVVVIGSDSPTLPAAILTSAFPALRRGGDVVLGPAEDGGYYLVGARAPLRVEMFEGIPWGTERVMNDTLAALDRSGTSAFLLPRWIDVDRPHDLEKVRRDLDSLRGDDPAPGRTRAFVEELVKNGRLPPAL